jgi:hypothetical protein
MTGESGWKMACHSSGSWSGLTLFASTGAAYGRAGSTAAVLARL